MNKSTLFFLPFISILLICQTLSAQESQMKPSQKESLVQLKKLHAIDRIQIDRNGIPSLIAGKLTPQTKGNFVETSFHFLNENRNLFRMNEATKEFKLQNEQKDKMGSTHITLQQVHIGIPIWGKDLRFHYSVEGELKSVNGNYIPDIQIETTPGITSEIAGIKAITHAEGGRVIQSQLLIFPNNKGYKLAWKLEVRNDSPVARWDYFVDAKNGEIIHRINKIFVNDVTQETDKPKLKDSKSAIVAQTKTYTLPESISNKLDARMKKSEDKIKTLNYGWNQVYSENFESDFIGDWQIEAFGVDATWGKTDCDASQGTYSVGCAVAGTEAINCGEVYPNEMYSYMITGPFSLSGASEANFDFWYNLNTVEEDGFFAGYSIDGNDFSGQEFYGTSEGWANYTLDLNDVIGEETVWIAFFFVSQESGGSPNGVFIDDLSVSKFVNNSNPEGLEVTELTGYPNPVLLDEELQIEASIKNNGISSVSDISVEFYLSGNENLDDNDCFLGEQNLTLGSGSTTTLSLDVDLSTLECLKNAGNYIVAYFTNEDDAWFSEEKLIITSCSEPGGQIGSGIGVLGDTKLNLNTICDGSIYRLNDITRLEGEESIQVFESVGDFFTDELMSDLDNIWNHSAQGAGVDALTYSGYVSDYMQNQFARNSWNNMGSSLINILNNNMAGSFNAFWDGEKINFGSGDPLSLAGALDVVAHEWGHAITETESNLAYEKESGALNEAFSDMLGVAIGFTYNDPDWLMGDDIFPGPFRDMENPQNYMQPEFYVEDPYWIDVINCSPDGGNDYCGVHTNSGVPNKMFYLLSEGGTFHDITVEGIGIDNAMAIMYHANAYYWTTTSTFWEAKAGCEMAANDLDGSGAWAEQVTNAWLAVGVDNEGPPPVEYCSGISYLTDASGTFSDGSGSASYINNMYCEWLISPTGASTVTLSFSEFSTESGYDYVHVFDGPTSSYPELGVFTGNSLPEELVSTGTSMFVVFYSDNSATYPGFTANYYSDGLVPGINITSPNGGESITGGETHPITWYTDGTSAFVKLILSTDGGLTYDRTISQITDDDGLFNWEVPYGIETNSARVKIKSTTTTNFEDESNFNFTIQQNPVSVNNTPLVGNMLQQNIPNPFSTITHIGFTLNSPAHITLRVCNAAGLEVQHLGTHLYSEGSHQVEFDGSQLNEGIYYYKLETDGFVDVKKMIVLR